MGSSSGSTSVGKGGILACGRVLAFGAMVAWASVLKVIYDWFQACQVQQIQSPWGCREITTSKPYRAQHGKAIQSQWG